MPETQGITFPGLDGDGNTKTVQELLSGTETYFFSPSVCDETTLSETE